MAQREYQALDEEPMEAESTEEALGLMVNRLHPRQDVTEYLTVLTQREVYATAALMTAGEVLKETNHPTASTLKWLGIDPNNKYKIYVKVGVEKSRTVVDGKLIETIHNLYNEREVDASEYAKYIIRTDRGVAQALVFAIQGKHLDNYRVAKDGFGRRGAISIGTSMVTGKQESSIGVLGRFRRALGQK